MFLLIGALFIISQNNLAFSNSENISQFSGLYVSWLGQVFQNSGKIAGYVVKLDWLPENSSG